MDCKTKHGKTPSAGGPGGTYGGVGKDGPVYLLNDLGASISNVTEVVGNLNIVSEDKWRRNNYTDLPPEVVFKMTFVNSSESTTTTNILYGGTYPTPTMPAAREGYLFNGYYTERNGQGTCWYNANLEYMLGDTMVDIPADVTLYASWRLIGGGAQIIVKDGQKLVIDEYSGVAEYLQNMEKHLILIERGGSLVLRNLSFRGGEGAKVGLIYNEGRLMVSNCAFRACTSMKGWGGVYSDRPGAWARFFGCTFSENQALEGGVVAADGSDVAVVSSTFRANRSLTACDKLPGGAAVVGVGGARLSLLSCTFVSNEVARAESSSAVLAFHRIASDSMLVNNLATSFAPVSVMYFEGLLGLDQPDVQMANNLSFFASEESLLSRKKTRLMRGVEQEYYNPMGRARQEGIADRLARTEDWSLFSYTGVDAEHPVMIDGDQLEQYPIAGRVGARTGNTLQHLIDVHDLSTGPLVVPPGRYDPVVVSNAIEIVGLDRDNCIVDGDAEEPCVVLTSAAEDAWWKNFTFRYGVNMSGEGGAWQLQDSVLQDSVPLGSASNCVFQSNVASNGAALAAAKYVCDSLFTNNTALASGGGTYKCAQVERCRFFDNIAGRSGGGSCADGRVLGSLYWANQAPNGGGGANSTFYCCTFAQNSGSSPALGAAYASLLYGCALYASALPTDDSSYVEFSGIVTKSHFFNAAAGDFHLLIRENHQPVNHEQLRITSTSIRQMAEQENWRDVEGNPFVVANPVTGEKFMYGGCYAFVPFKTNGLVVNGADEWYDSTNFKTSLREAVEEAKTYAQSTNFVSASSTTNELVITFDESMFTDEWGIAHDSVTIPFSEAQIDVDGFTNATLVVRGPTNHVVCLDGQGDFRAFRIGRSNRVRFENLTFQNCYGSPFGQPQATTDGGAVQNAGILSVSNCVFKANSAGGLAYDAQKEPIGYGGAIATLSGATTTVYAASFIWNQAVRGGAVYTCNGGATRFFHSTFNGNACVGSSGSSRVGGALASDPAHTNSTLWLVNCTLAGNQVRGQVNAGGAICAKAGLVLLNSVVVGNTSGDEPDDIKVAADGSASFAYTVFGTRSQTNKSYHVAWNDLQIASGSTANEMLAVTNAVTVETWPQHWVMPINAASPIVTNGFPSAAVWVSRDWTALGCSRSPTNKCEHVLVGSKAQLTLRGIHPAIDQIGEEFEGTVLGALASNWSKQDPDEASGDDPGDDPGGEEDVPEEEAVVSRMTANGKTLHFRTVEDLLEKVQPTDVVVLKSPDDEATMFALFDALDAKAAAAGWYAMETEDGVTYSFSLVADVVRPVAEAIDFDVDDPNVVKVRPGNVIPGLWYSLEGSATVVGPYTPGNWVQADAEGRLPGPLEAPRLGEAGFYRVVVALLPPEE